jgi:hypothetical protein
LLGNFSFCDYSLWCSSRWSLLFNVWNLKHILWNICNVNCSWQCLEARCRYKNTGFNYVLFRFFVSMFYIRLQRTLYSNIVPKGAMPQIDSTNFWRSNILLISP